MHPAVEKTLFMAVEDAGIVSKSKASLDSIGYVASEVIQKSIRSVLSLEGATIVGYYSTNFVRHDIPIRQHIRYNFQYSVTSMRAWAYV